MPERKGVGKKMRVKSILEDISWQRFPLAVIKSEERRLYLNALAQADKGDLIPFATFVGKSLIATQEVMVKDLRENPDQKKGFAFSQRWGDQKGRIWHDLDYRKPWFICFTCTIVITYYEITCYSITTLFYRVFWEEGNAPWLRIFFHKKKVNRSGTKI